MMTANLQPTAASPLFFLKLGGSLITDKRQSEQVRAAVLHRLAVELAAVRAAQPTLRLIIAHGSGSFGHVHAKRYGTRAGVKTPAEWLGFALTADAAARLNRLVISALLQAGIPAWSLQPSALLRCVDGRIDRGMIDNIEQALACGLVPVVFGDVALDDVRGGTIASTEEIFEWLARALLPQRIVLAGEVDGIYTADPQLDVTAQRIAQLTPHRLAVLEANLGSSHGVDVTGGMAAKVAQSMRMIAQIPGLALILCSGLIEGNVQAALSPVARAVGTQITGD
ncbi:MAG: isopentenyl phosphate kinase family protein [Caldilineaceae bacterium]|nr:isopentenyl phosphate kinase family protein [Caldilineaceae bacterium]